MPDQKKRSEEREGLYDNAVVSMPEPVQKAPRKPESRQQKLSKYQKYGKAPPWRLPPELIDAVAIAASEQDVKPRDLAEFLIRAGLELLAVGRIDLPRREGETPGKVIVKYPAIPGSYSRT